jgi:hypothetical protein
MWGEKMRSGTKLVILALTISALMLIPSVAICEGTDVVVLWAVASFVSTLGVSVAIFMVSLLLLMFPSNRKQQTAAIRHIQSLCVQCGYDLRSHGLGSKCPECGAIVPPPFQEESPDDDDH